MASLYGQSTQCWWVIPTNCPGGTLVVVGAGDVAMWLSRWFVRRLSWLVIVFFLWVVWGGVGCVMWHVGDMEGRCW